MGVGIAAEQWKQRAVARLENTGFKAVTAFNPFWDERGKTFKDPDGYRVVLQNANWPGLAATSHRRERRQETE